MHISYRYDRDVIYIPVNGSVARSTPGAIEYLIDQRISELRKRGDGHSRHLCEVIRISQSKFDHSIQ